MIGNSKKINILDDEFFNINFNILNQLSEQRRGKFKVFKTKLRKGKTATSDNIDTISSLILLSEFKNRLRKDLLPVYKNTIRPLYFMHLEEIELYAKLKKLRIKKRKLPTRQKKVMNFINDMEKQYSGTKNNIVKSYIELINNLIDETEEERYKKH